LKQNENNIWLSAPFRWTWRAVFMLCLFSIAIEGLFTYERWFWYVQLAFMLLTGVFLLATEKSVLRRQNQGPDNPDNASSDK
jgi:hypothetical protein